MGLDGIVQELLPFLNYESHIIDFTSIHENPLFIAVRKKNYEMVGKLLPCFLVEPRNQQLQSASEYAFQLGNYLDAFIEE